MQINDSFLATAAAAIIVIIIIRYCDMMWLVLLGTYCNVFCKVLYTYMIWNYREVQIEGWTLLFLLNILHVFEP
jgi:hypothetical protein